MPEDRFSPSRPYGTARCPALRSDARSFAAALLIGFLASSALLFSPQAAAHGRLGAAEGRCRLFIGPDYMNFTGYLPNASKLEFCEDIPASGQAIIVLDAVQEELRDMKVEIRIVKDVGGEKAENENLAGVTVAYREPRTYPTGTITFEHFFPEPGYFVGVVTAHGAHGEAWVSRFPFSVDKSFARQAPYYILMSLGVVAACVIYFKHRLFLLKPAGASSQATRET